MKTQDYNLSNEEFAFFVNRASEALRGIGIPHAFVGGVAVQAHTLKRLCNKYSVDISTLAASNKHIRFQDYIRSTDDVDIALLFPDNAADYAMVGDVVGRLYDSLNGVYLSNNDKHIFEYKLERRGFSRPVFSISVDNVLGKNLSLNISKQSRHLRALGLEYYDQFIEEGETLELTYSPGFNLRLRVYNPTHVLATKISQFRAKDSMDIVNLEKVLRESGGEINEEELRRILLPVHTNELAKYNSLTGRDIDLSYSCNH